MKTLFSRPIAACAAALCLFSAASLHADNFSTVYAFPTARFSTGPGPGTPGAGVIIDGSILYGTTLYGGLSNDGTVYSYNLNTSTETTLHTFSGSDGANPNYGVTLVGSTLYGSTSNGGAGVSEGQGTLFSIGANGSGFTSLLSFANQGVYPYDDGIVPTSNVTPVGSLLYGTTSLAGPTNMLNGGGVLFSYDPASGQLTNLHSFGSAGDGSQPAGGLTDIGGTLYGTTGQGGTADFGTIFSYNLSTGQETVLYSFLGEQSADGRSPEGGLTLVGSTLYGVTDEGGAIGNPGTLFSYNLITGQESVLHIFGTGTDGEVPSSPLVLVNSTLYGTTSGPGTIYSYNIATGTYSIVHDFVSNAGGLQPDSLVLSGTTLYGTTANDGQYGGGTIFAFQTPEPSACFLAAFGLTGIAAWGWRRKPAR